MKIKTLVQSIRSYQAVDRSIEVEITDDLGSKQREFAETYAQAKDIAEDLNALSIAAGITPDVVAHHLRKVEAENAGVVRDITKDIHASQEMISQRQKLIEVLEKIDEFSEELDINDDVVNLAKRWAHNDLIKGAALLTQLEGVGARLAQMLRPPKRHDEAFNEPLKAYVLTGNAKQLIDNLADGNKDFGTVLYYMEKLTTYPSDNALLKKLYHAITDLKEYGVQIKDKSVVRLAMQLHVQLAEFGAKFDYNKTGANKQEFVRSFLATVTSGSKDFNVPRNGPIYHYLGAIYKYLGQFFTQPKEKRHDFAFFMQTTRQTKTNVVSEDARSLLNPETVDLVPPAPTA